MSIIELLKIEFMKVKRSMILPLLLIPPILVVISGVSSISMYMTPEYTDAWSAMFIQSALLLFTSIFNGNCLRYDFQQRNKE